MALPRYVEGARNGVVPWVSLSPDRRRSQQLEKSDRHNVVTSASRCGNPRVLSVGNALAIHGSSDGNGCRIPDSRGRF